MIEIHKTTVSEILAQHNAHIIEEYSNESSISLLPKPKAQFEMYSKLEFNGALECFGGYLDNKLIGFFAVIPTVIPHYGSCVLMVESIFVCNEYRKTGLGIKFIKKLESIAKDKKALCIFMSAPVNSRLSKLLPNVGYQHTNNVMCKQIYYE